MLLNVATDVVRGDRKKDKEKLAKLSEKDFRLSVAEEFSKMTFPVGVDGAEMCLWDILNRVCAVQQRLREAMAKTTATNAKPAAAASDANVAGKDEKTGKK